MKKINKPELIEILARNSFFVLNTHIFKNNLFDFTFLYSDVISKGIIIKEYNDEESLKSVNQEVVLVKEILKKLNYNVWNVYYFVLIDIGYEQNKKFYSIERDSRNMRKYILQTVEDVKRVPFLEVVSNSEKEKKVLIDFHGFIEDSKDIEINNIVTEIINCEGEYKELSKQKIRNILKEKLSQGENL